MPWTNEAIEQRSLKSAMLRGLMCRCPRCGEGRLFSRFTTVVGHCERCGEDLSHQRADDAPPYFVMVIVGHVIVALALMVERAYQPALWVHMVIWLPLAVVLSLALLPPIKGAIVGLQWANRMHGFGGPDEE